MGEEKNKEATDVRRSRGSVRIADSRVVEGEGALMA